MEWIELAQDGGRWRTIVIAVINFGFQKCGEFLDKVRQVNISSRTVLHGLSKYVSK